MSKFDQSSIRNQINDIIENFVKKEIIEESLQDSKFWSRESFMARSLIKKFTYEKLVFLDLGFKVNSLVFFRTLEGSNKIRKKLAEESGIIYG